MASVSIPDFEERVLRAQLQRHADVIRQLALDIDGYTYEGTLNIPEIMAKLRGIAEQTEEALGDVQDVGKE